MTDRLVEDPDAVAVLASTVSDRTGIPAAHIEKDFWVTEVLRGVVAAAAAADVEVVFKGGTSLSKAFGLIERFSEDVDVLVVLPANDSNGVRDRVLKAIVDGAAKAAGVAATPVPEATSKGVKRGARFHYRPGDDPNTAGLTPGVFLELGSRGGGMPATPLEVSSIIAVHAADEIAGAEEATPVVVRVQAPWRTLVEKLVLLHTAHSGDDPTAAIRGARHFCDVHQLVVRPEIIAGIHECGVAILARDVCTYSRAADMPAIDRPTGGFASSPAFNDGPYIAAARAEYEQRVLAQLLWPSASKPTFDDCVEAVRQRASHL